MLSAHAVKGDDMALIIRSLVSIPHRVLGAAGVRYTIGVLKSAKRGGTRTDSRGLYELQQLEQLQGVILLTFGWSLPP